MGRYAERWPPTARTTTPPNTSSTGMIFTDIFDPHPLGKKNARKRLTFLALGYGMNMSDGRPLSASPIYRTYLFELI
ncbi:hypothetical protein FRUB_05621 [Fimbriiglobus ruber]|uniref:Uncharacterized protein n=1 Tax=Fimbriiglobus ruber TaxID=1908690 RepID=A0A225DDV3_9BACT|nr:hypothetical protein FRUB_05621 [Fimbriiglobus ruber]